jgi:hypothetical protein
MADAIVFQKFYTYVHRRVDDCLVFYVGKGTGKRIHSRDKKSAHWHATVKKHGMHAEIIARWELESDAFEHEKLLISYFRKIGHPLCNQTEGGDGATGHRHTAETRAKISELLKGKKRTEEQKRRNSEARIGKSLNLTDEQRNRWSAIRMGHQVSAETRAKISAGHIGMTVSAEARAKIGAANRGRVMSPEAIAKRSAAIKGQRRSPEAREKMSAWQRGLPKSQELRDKISKTLTGRRLSDEEKERLYPLTHSSEIRAKRSASIRAAYAKKKRVLHEGIAL